MEPKNYSKVRNIRCGLNHSGNDRLAKADRGYWQCTGCGRFYSTGQAETALGRAGQKGSGQLYDSTAVAR